MLCIVTLGVELLVTFVLTYVLKVSLTDYSGICFILIFGLSYILTVISSRKLIKFRRVLTVYFLLRVALLFWDLYGRAIFSLPSSGADTENFFRAAVNFADGYLTWNNHAVKVFGTLVLFFGRSRLLIQFLLMLFSIGTAHITVACLQMLEVESRSAQKGMWFMALLPMYAILSSVFLRESLVAFSVAVSLFLFIKWWKNHREIYIWAAMAVSLIGAVFHSGIVGVAVGYAIVRVLYDRKQKSFRVTAFTFLGTGVFLILFAFLYNRYSSVFFAKMGDIEELSDIASGMGRGGSSYAAIAGNSSNIFNFILFTPIRMALFLFTPLPFQIRGLSDLIAMVFSAFFYLWVYIRVIKTIRKRRNKNIHLMISLLIVALIIAFIFGWGGTNIGTQVRHRDKIMPIYIVLLALSFERENSASKKFLTQ